MKRKILVKIIRKQNRKILKRLELVKCVECGESFRQFKTVKGMRLPQFRNCPFCGFNTYLYWYW